jgi:hypothetical protein
VARKGRGRPRKRLVHLTGDKAYSVRAVRQPLRVRKIPHTIPVGRTGCGVNAAGSALSTNVRQVGDTPVASGIGGRWRFTCNGGA